MSDQTYNLSAYTSCELDRCVCTVKARYKLCDEDGCEYVTEQEHWGDLLKIKGKTANHCHALTRKQMASMGCPDWEQESVFFKEITTQNEDGTFVMKDDIPEPQYWSVINFTTDAAGDETKVREYCSFVLAAIPWMLCIHLACMLHQVQPSV